MKKILTTLILLAGFISAKAQFVINKAYMPSMFNKEFRANDTVPDAAITAGGNGAGQLWDFSMMKIQSVDTNTYRYPAGTPVADQFPGADLVLENQSKVSHKPRALFYLKYTGEYAGILGSYLENPGQPGMMISPKNTPVQRYWHFPATYLTSYKDTGAFVLVYKQQGSSSVDSVRVKYCSYNENTIDAYGTVITPAGTFSNAMRHKQYTLHADSVEVHVKTGSSSYEWQTYSANADTTTTYSWYAEMYKFPLTQLSYTSQQTKPMAASYLVNLNNATAVADVTSNNTNRAFPNPCSTEIAIQLQSAKPQLLEIYDIAGRLKYSNKVNGIHPESINTANYAPGVYLYKAMDASGSLLQSGKFEVMH